MNSKSEAAAKCRCRTLFVNDLSLFCFLIIYRVRLAWFLHGLIAPSVPFKVGFYGFDTFLTQTPQQITRFWPKQDDRIDTLVQNQPKRGSKVANNRSKVI